MKRTWSDSKTGGRIWSGWTEAWKKSVVMFPMLSERGPGPEVVCPRPACSVWVLDFVQEILHNTSPGDFQRLFIKAGDSETRLGLDEKD